jgi:hypothetical protein
MEPITRITEAAFAFSPNIDPREVLQYFSWWAYLVVALIYSAFVFRDEVSKEDRQVFDKQNLVYLPNVLLVHVAFIATLFALLRIIPYILPALPYWMTNVFKPGRSLSASIADILVVLIGVLMAYLERRRIYAESASDSFVI